MHGRGSFYLVYFESLLFPRFKPVSVLVIVLVVVVVYLTGMALKTGVLETQLPDTDPEALQKYLTGNEHFYDAYLCG